jgi:hypothetical protein
MRVVQVAIKKMRSRIQKLKPQIYTMMISGMKGVQSSMAQSCSGVYGKDDTIVQVHVRASTCGERLQFFRSQSKLGHS